MSISILKYLLLINIMVIFFFSLLEIKYLRKKVQKITYRKKIPYFIWLLYFFAIANFGKVDSTNVVIGNSAQLAIFFFICLFLFLYLLFPKQRKFRISNAIYSMFFYSFIGLFSATYSPAPYFTAYKAVFLFSSLVFITLMIMSFKDLKEDSNFLNFNILIIFALVIVYAVGPFFNIDEAFVYKRGMTLLPMLSGVIIKSNANTVGLVAGIASFFFLYKLLGRRKIMNKALLASCFSLSFMVLILAQSRTCFAAFLFIVLLLVAKKSKTLSIVAICLMLPIVVFFSETTDNFLLLFSEYIKRGQTEQQLNSLSGRVDAWILGWERFKEAPLIGYGMGAGVRFGAVAKNLTGSHMHNSYFEVLLNNGLLGFIPWFLAIISIMAVSLLDYIKTSDDRCLVALLFFFCFIRTFAGTTFVLFDYTFMFFCVFLVYATLHKYRLNPNL